MVVGVNGVEQIGAVILEGSNTTEATTTSTSTTDLLSVSSLSIAVGAYLESVAVIRKSTGAASGVGVGLKLNATVVRNNFTCSDSSDEVQEGLFNTKGIYGVASYLRSMVVEGRAQSTANGLVREANSADSPTATLTDVVLRGHTNNSSITMGADEMHVYTSAVS